MTDLVVDPAPTRRRDRVRHWLRHPDPGVLLLLAVSYIPLLFTKPGLIGADTKSYLYLNPGRLLSRAPYMWDTNIGLGTVTHQNIGYLWPMGPFYFFFDAIGVPDWIAQRLWLGTIILAAGLGVRWMLKELRWDGAGVTVAAFAYALSPYLLDYAARISVILLPFAGLPWLIGLSARALRRRDWRTPAIFALVTLTVGGVNATSLLLVMVAPMMWFVYATFIEREVTFPDALRTAGRITVLTAITSLWWVAGLVLQGSFGIPILRYTETYETVAASALAPELLRGLGYWFFYGRDGLGPWTASTVTMIQAVPALLLSYLIPGLALAAGVLTRWRHRVFFAAIIVVGLVMGVGAHPWESPTPYGSVFKAWTRSDMGLSFRSTPRAVPLIVLGLAVFLGSGVAALSRWRPKWHLPVAGLLIVLLCANQIALFRGQMVDRNLQRDEQVPEYWVDAADALSAGDPTTRVLEMPGIDFASYRWGNTVDPITPGLTDREFVARELIPYGSAPSANLLNDVDQPFQAGRVDPATIAPLARLMGVGDILFRADLQYERYLSPRPRHTYQQLLAAPGLGDPESFGDPVPNDATPELPLDDELGFGTPVTDPDPPPVSLFPVLDPRPTIRAVDATAPVVVAGNGAGLVNLASSGALQVDRPYFYAASFAGDDGDQLATVLDEPDASLVVTDTNRRQARRWGSVRENDGYTERAGEEPLVEDMTDNRLDVFPDETDADRTIVEQSGGATLSASAYGNGVTYTAGDRAVNAMDGTEATSWRVAAFEQAEGHFLEIDLAEPVTTDEISLRQVVGFKNRWMTGISLSFDDGTPVPFALDETSKEPGGQTLRFPERTFEHLRVTVESTDLGIVSDYKGVSDVGISELVIPGVEPVSEVVRPPVDLLDAAGEGSIDRELSYVFARRAPNPGDVIVADEEPTLRRLVIGPVRRAFTVFGLARMAADTPDAEVDRILGLPSAAEGGVTAESSRRLDGTLRSRASMAIDGDPTTSYQSPINGASGFWTRFTYPEPVTIDGLDMEVMTDGKHSVPTVVDVSVDGGEPVRVTLPAVELGEGNDRDATTTIPVATGPLTGTTFQIDVVSVLEAESKDWFGGARTVMPVGIAEIGLPVVEQPDAETELSTTCRDDMVTIAGTPVDLQVIGTVGQAEALQALQLVPCGESVDIDAGTNLLETAPGLETDFDVELLNLASAAGGGPGVDTLSDPPDAGPAGPDTTLERTGRLSYELDVTGADDPYWAVLGQSWSPGWTAVTSDGTDLGEPTLINGFANGWRVDPAVHGADTTITMKWTPQTLVWIGLGASAIGVLICLAIIIGRPRRGRRSTADDVPVDQVGPAAGSPEDEAPAAVSPAVVSPVFESPATVDGPPIPLPRALIATFVTGLLATFVGGVFVGAFVAALTLVAMVLRRGQLVTRVVCLGVFAAAFGYIIAKQARADYQVTFKWVEHFEITHAPTIAAVLLLLVIVVVDGARAGRAGNETAADDGTATDDGTAADDAVGEPTD